jgi:hypothetical protein
LLALSETSAARSSIVVRVEMWALDNRTPYPAERNWIRDKDGRHHWLVAVKASFDVSVDGRVSLADEQPPPALAPEYLGASGQSSLRWDSDLLFAKKCSDVVVEGQAYATGGARDKVQVSLRVGPIHKQLAVFGTRVYYKGIGGLAVSSPAPFVSRPIVYEWAFGGSDSSDPDPNRHRLDQRNPIGRGFAVNEDLLIDQPAHAIEYPGATASKVGPAGFGAIDPAWSPRRQRAGTYDEYWARTKKPLLPDDYDDLFGSSAPDDQRCATFLRGGEAVELENMTPGGSLRFSLPKIYPTYTTYFGSRAEEHRGRLVTVLLFPELMKLSLVWQTTLFVGPRDGDYLDRTQIGEKRYLT